MIGWTGALESLPKNLTPQQYAQYFSDKLLRPGIPHVDHRMSEAQRLGQVLGDVPRAKVNRASEQGQYNPQSVGKQGPTFNPASGFNTNKMPRSLKPNASVGNPVWQQAFGLM